MTEKIGPYNSLLLSTREVFREDVGNFKKSRGDASVVTPEAVESIIIRDTISIGDVADVYFGPEDARSLTRLDGRPVIGIGIVRQARSNTIEISDGINRVVGQLNRRFDDIDIVVTNDNAVFIKSSIREVLFTLSLTISIVIATIWLFIGSIRATLVPSIAIPVALIGTVAAIWVLGFSINILTLLALVLATGMVVDDAIVVLENIKRRRGQGLGARAAAVLGTRQVFFAVVTTTAVLVAVFVPIAFLPSTAGRLFREFGLVLAAAVVISSFVSLTLVPAAASRLPADFESHALRRAVKRFGGRLAGLYRRSLHFVLDYPFVPIAAALVFAAVSAGLFTQLDRSLLPDEDRGLVSIRASGPDGVGIGYMDRQTHKIEDMLGPLLERGEEWMKEKWVRKTITGEYGAGPRPDSDSGAGAEVGTGAGTGCAVATGSSREVDDSQSVGERASGRLADIGDDAAAPDDKTAPPPTGMWR